MSARPRAAIESRLDRLLGAAKPFGSRFDELGFDKRLTKQVAEQFKKRLADLSVK
jgi:hypothetical protein